MDALKKLQDELEDLVLDKQLEEEIRVVDQNKENVYEAQSNIDKVLKATTTQALPMPAELSGCATAHPLSSAQVEHPSVPDTHTVPLHIHKDPFWPPHLVKHPKIAHPHFNVDSKNQTVLWDTFSSAAHTNE